VTARKNHRVTELLRAWSAGDDRALEELYPAIYDQLRRMAQRFLSDERPGHTLQATALVHEAYLRLVGSAWRAEPELTDGVDPRSRPADGTYNSRGHFFAAAAEAMRRILVENARQKKSLKRGGDGARVEFAEELSAAPDRRIDLLELDDALSELERHDLAAAHLVKLRYFAGYGHQEAAQALGIGRREADRLWALARAWLYQQLGDADA
jgi:RNA polymerase sigma factor (sigma-70 family)